MRVLHINAGNEDGGARTYIINLMKGQESTDVDATLMTFEEGPVARMARDNGLHVVVMPQKRQIDLSILTPLVTYINDHHIDVVHTHGPRANFIMSLVKNRIKATWVTTVHSDPRIDFSGLKGKIFLKLNVRALKQADYIFYMNPDLVAYFNSLHISKNKTDEVFNAIDFKQAIPEPQRQKHFSLLMIARLVEVKNHAMTLQALSKLDFDFKMIFVGDGPLMGELKQQTHQLGLDKKVQFVGFHENTGDYYDECDVSMLTSNSESLPTVYLESALHGRPVIATNVGATSKVINDKTGWLIQPGSVSELAEALNDAHKEWENDNLDSKGMELYSETKSSYSIEKLAEAVKLGYKAALHA
ncbi:glycosyltransferase [Companilactobacillus ginsenosidimutans]|uniref:Glycosyl transferase family 1 n=1 Tax=Companilactobacillus ginsenosidimutans TaxID=1007676 RepID=A0A0H4R2T9_9LACO|nr:glycosyltransferase [Companilactobacillus ginsenosidimutans]AKP68070.1 glycosyl transferase family 1 [Companilactobacillus ginsenosidimutans]